MIESEDVSERGFQPREDSPPLLPPVRLVPHLTPAARWGFWALVGARKGSKDDENRAKNGQKGDEKQPKGAELEANWRWWDHGNPETAASSGKESCNHRGFKAGVQGFAQGKGSGVRQEEGQKIMQTKEEFIEQLNRLLADVKSTRDLLAIGALKTVVTVEAGDDQNWARLGGLVASAVSRGERPFLVNGWVVLRVV